MPGQRLNPLGHSHFDSDFFKIITNIMAQVGGRRMVVVLPHVVTF